MIPLMLSRKYRSSLSHLPERIFYRIHLPDSKKHPKCYPHTNDGDKQDNKIKNCIPYICHVCSYPASYKQRNGSNG